MKMPKEMIAINFRKRCIIFSLMVLNITIVLARQSAEQGANSESLVQSRPLPAERMKRIREAAEILNIIRLKYFDQCEYIKNVECAYIIEDYDFHSRREAFIAPVRMEYNYLFDYLHHNVPLPKSSDKDFVRPYLFSYDQSTFWDEILTEGELVQIRNSYFRDLNKTLKWQKGQIFDSLVAINVTDHPKGLKRKIIKKRLSFPIYTRDRLKSVVFAEGLLSDTILILFFEKKDGWALRGVQTVGRWNIPYQNPVLMEQFYRKQGWGK